MKIFVIFLILISSISLNYSHVHEIENEDNNSNIEKTSSINPFKYFANGLYTQGTFILILWVLILKGFYELTLLVLARAIK